MIARSGRELPRRSFLSALGFGAAWVASSGASRSGFERPSGSTRHSGAPSIRTPGEWEPHSAMLMAWPHSRKLWVKELENVKFEIAAIARAITPFEPVLMAATQATAREARRACGRDVDVVELPLNDCWIRDNGPIFIQDSSVPGGLIGLDWGFNAWGGKFPPWHADDVLPERLDAHLGVPTRRLDMILEGGSVQIDGEGTLITTEQCLLNSNRNPGLSKVEIEGRLKLRFGVGSVLWLPHGLWLDTITNGHVDGVCMFVGPGTVRVQVTHNGTPDDRRLAENRAVLAGATDAQGRGLTILDLHPYPLTHVGGITTTHSYLNFALVNGGVIVPIAGRATDQRALDSIRAAFPAREVVGVRTRALDFGGGGVHCVTQHVPAVPPRTGPSGNVIEATGQKRPRALTS